MPPLSLPALRAPAWRGAVLLTALMAASNAAGVSAMAAPFSASCVLLTMLPQAPFSQPRALLLSHLVCLACGALALWLPLPQPLPALAAAWSALMLMAYLRAVHAPAIAHAVILAFGHQTLVAYLPGAATIATCMALVARRVPIALPPTTSTKGMS